MAAAMLMVGGPSEAKMHAGKAGNSSESSQGGYDMTGHDMLGLCCSSHVYDVLQHLYFIMSIINCRL